MNQLLSTAHTFFQEYSPIHQNVFLLMFISVLVSYGITYMNYLVPEKFNRTFSFLVYLPLLILVKISFGTTLFVHLNTSLFDVICYTIPFLVYFLFEITFLRLSMLTYHEAKERKISNRFGETYFLSIVSFTLSFLSFYPIVI